MVTGAAGWLGRAVMEQSTLRPSVGAVIAVYRRTPPPLSVPANATVLSATDLATAEGIRALRSAVEGCGLHDTALLHCAGAFPPAAALHNVGLDTVRQSLAANVESFVGAVSALVPIMRSGGRGRIVAFSSHTRREAYPFIGAFNIAKAALEAAVQTVANENARFGITANTISVATLQTDEERRIKPAGRYADWVPPETLSEFALDIALSGKAGLNGSELHYWLYSSSFFGESVFARNSIDPSEIDP